MMSALRSFSENTSFDDDAWIQMSGNLETRLQALHHEIRQIPKLNNLDRISVWVYDSKLDHINTFLESNVGPRAPERTSDSLGHHPSLLHIAQTGHPWIDNNITKEKGDYFKDATENLLQRGYRSRYVVRLHRKDTLYGFLFFKSRQTDFFSPDTLQALLPYRRLIDVLVIGKLAAQRTMLAAVRTALQVSQYRDEETGAHLDRMSHYSEVIAQNMSKKKMLSNEYIEYVYRYSPLHDIGKVAVPDNILLKPGKFTNAEFDVMKTHVTKGVEIIRSMVNSNGLHSLPHLDVLLNIVNCHHECFDGTGYPNNLSGMDIPLEGRIVTVADVFDALTSKRPYKEAWTNEAAATFLREHAGQKFDPECVEALLVDWGKISQIQKRFRDAPT
jgi:two-component system, response regulator RpfG